MPGEPAKSLVIERVFAGDHSGSCRPPLAHKELTPKQKDTIRQWIAEGARYEEHWSYQPVRRPTVPQPTAAIHPVDSFVRARLRAADLRSSPEADRRTLIRRVSFDLTGVPPSLEEKTLSRRLHHPDGWTTVRIVE